MYLESLVFCVNCILNHSVWHCALWYLCNLDRYNGNLPSRDTTAFWSMKERYKERDPEQEGVKGKNKNSECKSSQGGFRNRSLVKTWFQTMEVCTLLATVDTKYDSKTKLKRFQRLSKVKKTFVKKSLKLVSTGERAMQKRSVSNSGHKSKSQDGGWFYW